MKEQRIVRGIFCLFVIAVASCAQSKSAGRLTVEKSISPISWGRCLSQKPEFYASDEAIRIADNVLLYQRDTGGWPSNINMTVKLTENEKDKIRNAKGKEDSTFDNGASHTHLRYLAKVYNATRLERFKQGFYNGVDYLLKAQYANGGWPQTYPSLRGYSKYITFNDGAMIGAMSVLRDIACKKPQYAFVGEDRRRRAEKAVQKGVECILNCQIVVDGKKTAWCAQHDENTFAPRKARSYELPSISGAESVGIVRFLMSIDKPDPEIIEAVQIAVAWFDHVRLTGIRQINKPDESLEGGYDEVIVEDATASPIWARFYQIRTNRPIFCGRDGEVKYRLAEIEHERRTGYAWYGYWPADLLTRDYSDWQKKWAPGKNVLGN